MKRILIIPGAGSSKLNWLDQFIEFERLGCQASFLDYYAEHYEDFNSFSYGMKLRLNEYFHTISKQNEKPNIIIAHSMGAMKLINVLKYLSISKEQPHSNQNKFLIENLKKTKIVLVQMPIVTKKQVLNSLKASYPLVSLMIKLHSPFRNFLSDILSDIKTGYFVNEKIKLIKPFFDTLWILSAMHVSAYTTSEKSFEKMVEFYDSWNLFKDNEYQFLKDYDIHMTVSNSDFFVAKEESLKFAEMISAKTKNFDWTFHNPMHFPWSQKEFNEWVLRLPYPQVSPK